MARRKCPLQTCPSANLILSGHVKEAETENLRLKFNSSRSGQGLGDQSFKAKVTGQLVSTDVTCLELTGKSSTTAKFDRVLLLCARPLRRCLNVSTEASKLF